MNIRITNVCGGSPTKITVGGKGHTSSASGLLLKRPGGLLRSLGEEQEHTAKVVRGRAHYMKITGYLK